MVRVAVRSGVIQLYYNYFRTYDPATGRYLESDPIGLAAGLNTYLYVGNMPTMQTDRYGLINDNSIYTGLPSQHQDALRQHRQRDRGPAPISTMYGAEGHFIVGGGLAAVNCEDECGEVQTFRFAKICLGGAAGAAGGGGVVTGLSGKRCRQENYEGWFFEAGGTLGLASAGADLGFNRTDPIGPLPFGLPYGMSGVNEYHGGAAPRAGAQFKVTWCYYIPLQ